MSADKKAGPEVKIRVLKYFETQDENGEKVCVSPSVGVVSLSDKALIADVLERGLGELVPEDVEAE